MCTDCLYQAMHAAGVAVVVVTEQHAVVGDLIRRVYQQDWGGTGGPLHVQLDDNNLDEGFMDVEGLRQAVWGLLPYYLRDGYPFTDEDLALCEQTLVALAAMSEVDRNLAVEAAEPYLSEDRRWRIGQVVPIPHGWQPQPDYA